MTDLDPTDLRDRLAAMHRRAQAAERMLARAHRWHRWRMHEYARMVERRLWRVRRRQQKMDAFTIREMRAIHAGYRERMRGNTPVTRLEFWAAELLRVVTGWVSAKLYDWDD